MVVLDTSVIVKWFIEEKGSERALLWLEKHIKKEEIILVPSLFFYEIANVLRYNKRLPTDEILNLVEELFRLNLKIEEVTPELIMRGVVLAREKNISIYDAIFVVLAKIYQLSFYTADEKLYKKVKGLGFVKLL